MKKEYKIKALKKNGKTLTLKSFDGFVGALFYKTDDIKLAKRGITELKIEHNGNFIFGRKL